MDKYDIFTKWLQDNGAIFPNIYLEKLSDTERGIKTNLNINENDYIIKIPFKLLITNKSKINGFEFNYELPNNIWNRSNILILLSLASELKNINSFYNPYIDILPKKKDLLHLPIFWSNRRIEKIKNTLLYDKINSRYNILKLTYDKLCNCIKDFDSQITFDSFIYLYSIISSRAFGITINSEKIVALVPLGDMLNHSSNNNVTWSFDNHINCFTMIANKQIIENQSVYDTYGKLKSDEQFLILYGFCPEKDDDYVLKLKNNNSELSKKEKKLVEKIKTMNPYNSNISILRYLLRTLRLR